MGHGIHDLKVTDRQNNPLEELIMLHNTVCASSDIYKEMMKSSFFKCFQNLTFFMLVLNHFLCFLLFFFSNCSPKLGCILYTVWACFMYA